MIEYRFWRWVFIKTGWEAAFGISLIGTWAYFIEIATYLGLGWRYLKRLRYGPRYDVVTDWLMSEEDWKDIMK